MVIDIKTEKNLTVKEREREMERGRRNNLKKNLLPSRLGL